MHGTIKCENNLKIEDKFLNSDYLGYFKALGPNKGIKKVKVFCAQLGELENAKYC